MKDTSKASLRRGHNEGNIRQRTDGRWEVRLSAGIDYKTGKPKRTSTCCNTRQEAIAILQDRKSTRLNSSHSDRSRMPSSA